MKKKKRRNVIDRELFSELFENPSLRAPEDSVWLISSEYFASWLSNDGVRSRASWEHKRRKMQFMGARGQCLTYFKRVFCFLAITRRSPLESVLRTLSPKALDDFGERCNPPRTGKGEEYSYFKTIVAFATDVSHVAKLGNICFHKDVSSLAWPSHKHTSAFLEKARWSSSLSSKTDFT